MKYTIQTTKLVIVSGLALFASACATQKTLLTAPMVSMSDANDSSTAGLKPSGNIESQYCYGEDPIATKNKNDIGMMDEVILRAQQQSGAKYIQNATFIAEGKCLKLEGVAMK